MYCGCNPADKVSITMNSELNVDGEQIDEPPLCYRTNDRPMTNININVMSRTCIRCVLEIPLFPVRGLEHLHSTEKTGQIWTCQTSFNTD